MTTAVSCPEFVLLSQFFDHEIGGAEAERIAHHVNTCSICREQLDHIQRAEEIEGAGLPPFRGHTSPPTPVASCVPLEMIAAYTRGTLSATEEQNVESHLSTCDTCLEEAAAVVRATSTLTTTRMEAVPTTLEAHVSSRWERPSIVENPQSLPRLVIQLTQKGLRLIERHLVPPLLDVQEILGPTPALRKGERGERRGGLRLRLSAEQAEISVLAVKDQDGVVVKLTLVGAEREELAGRRIFLRQHGRAVFSDQTNERGELLMPFLPPGLYEVACHEIHTTFLLELHP